MIWWTASYFAFSVNCSQLVYFCAQVQRFCIAHDLGLKATAPKMSIAMVCRVMTAHKSRLHLHKHTFIHIYPYYNSQGISSEISKA